MSVKSDPYLEHFRLIARYNKWAYQRVLAAANSLQESDYLADHGLPFLSIHGTLTHLYFGDILWFMRMTAEESVGPHDYQTVAQFWNGPADAWGKAIATRNDLEYLIMKQCDRLIALVDSMTSERLQGSFTFKDTTGTPYERPLGPILDHVVNHGTHHRGQVSAVVSKLGRPYPVMDMVYFLREYP